MPRHILSLSIFSLSMISGSVLAATNSPGGIISFSGAISDTTCTINGGNSADMAIALDPIVPADAGTSANTVITKNQKNVCSYIFKLRTCWCRNTNWHIKTAFLIKYYFSLWFVFNEYNRK
ncbi:Uncharacterised protein [Providencia rustigianii]|nr:Uncharacterised protein [Providencia rustigianii]